MKIMIGIGHPKDVHFWKNIIRKLINNGHEIQIVVTAKDITIDLLKAYGFDYIILWRQYTVGKKRHYLSTEN